jgi:FdhD protein
MPWPIRRITDQGEQQVETGVVIEEPLEIRIGGLPVGTLMRTPGLDKELAAGFCLGEGLIADMRDIALIRHCGRTSPGDQAEGDPLDLSRNRVDVTLMPGAAPLRQGHQAVLIRSGCGRTDAATLAEGLEPISAGVEVRLEKLQHLIGQIGPQQAAYRAAGGIHAAAILDTGGRLVIVAEDVGRHNAVDKATGYCLLQGIPLHDKLLVSTGRASYDMVAKGVRLGLPILASLSSPTSAAVELAQALNCTLVGYLRGKALNVYTHGRRILIP